MDKKMDEKGKSTRQLVCAITAPPVPEREDVRKVVAEDGKSRFSLSEDLYGRPRIRANQGHSIKEGLDDEKMLEKVEVAPSHCYHGTYLKNVRDILQRGSGRCLV